MSLGGGIPAEALLDLRRRLDALPPRDPGRRVAVDGVAGLYGLSRASVYRLLARQLNPKGVRRTDRGNPRRLRREDLERYCEIIAALKVRTSNLKKRHLSTINCIRLLETSGVETPVGLVHAPAGLLNKTTVNRYLRLWGYDHTRMTRAPAAVRFEAQTSNQMWQFDISPSDLKDIPQPAWIDPDRKGRPVPMLFSVVDDRSGASYQEYRCVYGEDVESGLRFLFNAMAPKDEEPAIQGIPETLYLDNGPIAKSGVFNTVMERLGVEVKRHQPAGRDGRRPTARSKGKVERPFRTVKEAHETLYHFHKPGTEAEANAWLDRYIRRYNTQPHRREAHSRIEDWMRNLPDKGFRQMCSWERFCTFAREPEKRKVAGDARIRIDGTYYEVDSDLAGEVVTVWWGLFDQKLFVEFQDRKYGPYSPTGGPIPLHRYRRPRKSATQKRADKISDLAQVISIPRTALSGVDTEHMVNVSDIVELRSQAFVDPDPYGQFTYANRLEALRGISDILHLPLARLDAEDLSFVNELVERTLGKAVIKQEVAERFPPGSLRARKDPPQC